MNLSSLLNATELTLMNTGYYINLDFLGKFARAIIEGVGIIGLGIIVFTLVLKAITLPFDIYQRIKMRKQTLIMRNMKDDLEKLQKQYANDKTMYNQKMYELQKKNGYSMLGACLPMILSLVILIVAFQGFRSYADYANLKTFEVMSEHFNAAVLEHSVDGKDYHLPVEGETGEGEPDELAREFIDKDSWTEDGIVYTMLTETQTVTVRDPDTDEERTEEITSHYLQVESADTSVYIYYRYNYDNSATACKHVYHVNAERLVPLLNEEEKAAYDGAEGSDAKESYLRNYVYRIGAAAAADYFRKDGPSFLWIGNVWYPDVSYDHPIPTYKSLTSQIKKVRKLETPKETTPIDQVLSQYQYDNLVSELTSERNSANGYYILIILSVGLMVLSQFVSMRSNKESNKYQTVDGKGARTQKIMMVVLPLIYAVFAFMYSAAFSIYMIVSSAFSIIVTLLANLVIGHVFNKKEEAKFREENSRVLPWMDKYGNKKSAKPDKSAKKEKKKK